MRKCCVRALLLCTKEEEREATTEEKQADEDEKRKRERKKRKISKAQIPTSEIVLWIGFVLVRIRVEVAHVLVVLELGHVGRLERAVAQLLPAEALEPLVLLYVLDAAALVADAVDRVLLAEALDERRGCLGYAARKVDGLDALQNDVVGGHGIVADEGRIAGEQLEYENAQAPAVGGDVVALVEYDLGRDILGRAAERPRLVAEADLLGEAEVDELAVAARVQQQILGLQVAVDGALGVQVGERLHHARRVEFRLVLVELAALLEHAPQLAAQTHLEHQVQVLLVLERLVEAAYEVRARLEHDVALVEHVVLLLGLHDVLLFEHLERIGAMMALVAHQLDATEATRAKRAEYFESFLGFFCFHSSD